MKIPCIISFIVRVVLMTNLYATAYQLIEANPYYRGIITNELQQHQQYRGRSQYILAQTSESRPVLIDQARQQSDLYNSKQYISCSKAVNLFSGKYKEWINRVIIFRSSDKNLECFVYRDHLYMPSQKIIPQDLTYINKEQVNLRDLIRSSNYYNSVNKKYIGKWSSSKNNLAHWRLINAQQNNKAVYVQCKICEQKKSYLYVTLCRICLNKISQDTNQQDGSSDLSVAGAEVISKIEPLSMLMLPPVIILTMSKNHYIIRTDRNRLPRRIKRKHTTYRTNNHSKTTVTKRISMPKYLRPVRIGELPHSEYRILNDLKLYINKKLRERVNKRHDEKVVINAPKDLNTRHEVNNYKIEEVLKKLVVSTIQNLSHSSVNEGTFTKGTNPFINQVNSNLLYNQSSETSESVISGNSQVRYPIYGRPSGSTNVADDILKYIQNSNNVLQENLRTDVQSEAITKKQSVSKDITKQIRDWKLKTLLENQRKGNSDQLTVSVINEESTKLKSLIDSVLCQYYIDNNISNNLKPTSPDYIDRLSRPPYNSINIQNERHELTNQEVSSAVHQSSSLNQDTNVHNIQSSTKLEEITHILQSKIEHIVESSLKDGSLSTNALEISRDGNIHVSDKILVNILLKLLNQETVGVNSESSEKSLSLSSALEKYRESININSKVTTPVKLIPNEAPVTTDQASFKYFLKWLAKKNHVTQSKVERQKVFQVTEFRSTFLNKAKEFYKELSNLEMQVTESIKLHKLNLTEGHVNQWYTSKEYERYLNEIRINTTNHVLTLAQELFNYIDDNVDYLKSPNDNSLFEIAKEIYKSVEMFKKFIETDNVVLQTTTETDSKQIVNSWSEEFARRSAQAAGATKGTETTNDKVKIVPRVLETATPKTFSQPIALANQPTQPPLGALKTLVTPKLTETSSKPSNVEANIKEPSTTTQLPESVSKQTSVKT